jgi:hypothetical protein
VYQMLADRPKGAPRLAGHSICYCIQHGEWL